MPPKTKPFATVGQLTKAPGVNSPGKPASKPNIRVGGMRQKKELPPKPKGKGPWVWSNLNNRWTHPWCK